MASSRSAAGGPPPEVIPKRSTKAKIVEIAKGLGLEVKNATVVELKADIYFKHMGIPRTEHAIYERLVDVLRTKTELLKQRLGWSLGGHPSKEVIVLAWLKHEFADAPWPAQSLEEGTRRLQAQKEVQGAGWSSELPSLDLTTCPICKGAFWKSAAQLHIDIYHTPAQCHHCQREFPSRADLNRHLYQDHHTEWEEQNSRVR